ncbi:MAG: CehA/McbA family metallohydrolase [Gammaproteobacteria bacterium]|nr:CehA/McbA family metallohydrolase [Gammaproteobacteria bacterium]
MHATFRIRLLLALLVTALPAAAALAAAQVTVGPSPIPDGEAASAGDITVSNERLAFSMAIATSAPYGVPRGAIIDLAPVVDGKPQRDRVVFADFIPNNWSAWPNTYQKVDIIEHGPQQVVIKATRDWGQVTIATTYRLRAGSDRIELQTTMTNTGTSALRGLLSGLTLWPSAGSFFEVPGISGLNEGPSQGAISDRATAYDADWAITLHAPYLDYVGSNSKDLFRQHDLGPGESRSFDGWLQVSSRGDLAPVVAAEIERKRLPSGHVRGTVTSRDGKRVASPVVVVAKGGVPYAWTLGANGTYDLQLPVGDYELYATAAAHSRTPAVKAQITANGVTTQDFGAVELPGRVTFEVTDARTGHPLDARIAIKSGQKQLVEFLGRSTFFTELDRKGRYEVPMAPGHYELQVTSGGVFLGPAAMLKLDVKAGQPLRAPVTLTRLYDPPASGWYSADLHHHADQAEGVTPPEYLARSQFAAGLDLLFVSDHDSTANHAYLQRVADQRGVPFIASMELSPSWGHFNAWPLRPQGQQLAIDTSTATIDEVLAEARRQGAIVVQANHPFIPYGYFSSVANGVAPGGFNPGFDLAEINGDNANDDVKVTRALWQYWNAGHRYYFSAGTDVHDVWNYESGVVRLYARIEGTPSAAAFAQAAKDGAAYVSYGPLIFPGVMFGSDLKLKAGAQFALPFRLASVAGLREVRLIGAGQVVATRNFTDAPREAQVEFPLRATDRTWYAIEVEDAAGRKAYSNPVWVDVVEFVPPAAKP